MNKSAKAVKEAYDVWHRKRASDENGLLLTPWYKSVHDEIIGVRANHILEIGCGRGEFAILLSKLFPKAHITAIDFSQAAIEIAKNRPGSANVSFQQADACLLPFRNESFDLVISCECMEHVQESSCDGPRS